MLRGAPSSSATRALRPWPREPVAVAWVSEMVGRRAHLVPKQTRYECLKISYRTIRAHPTSARDIVLAGL